MRTIVLLLFLSSLAPLQAQTAAAAADSPQKILQVLNRLTFGATQSDYDLLLKSGVDKYIAAQLDPESLADDKCEALLAKIPDIQLSSWQLFEKYPFPGFKRLLAGKSFKRPSDIDIKAAAARNLNIYWDMVGEKTIRAVYSNRQLQELMTDFWFNHFNVNFGKRMEKYVLPAYVREVIRPNAFGKFRTLLGAVAHSPAMLDYLDNAASSKDARYDPDMETGMGMAAMDMSKTGGKGMKMGLNENYARELMELHTLGVDGGYSQKDVIEVARILTGWSFKGPDGLRNNPDEDKTDIFQFKFRSRAHDPGLKIVLGQSFGPGEGEGEGEALLDMLCRSPATAHFISEKLCRKFVCDDPPEALVRRVAARFSETDGDIRETLKAIFAAPEFFDSRYYRAKVKSPFEFVASALRVTGAEFTDGEKMFRTLNSMGEPLYRCEPPTGYPDTASAWVNSSALLARMNFSLILLKNKDSSPAQVDLASLNSQLSSGDGPALLNAFFRLFLNDQVSGSTKAILLEKLSDPELSHAVLDDPQKNFDAAQVGALVLGSPDFQRR